jgi:glycine betaine/proline transport system permease protein
MSGQRMKLGLASPVAASAALLAFAAFFLPLWDYPAAWQVDIASHLNRAFVWASRKAEIGPIAMKDLTRSLASLVEVPLDGLRGLLIEGFRLRLPVLGRVDIVAVPWWALAGAATVLAHGISGRKGVALVLGTCAYLLVFDLWHAAMLTLASVGLSVAVAAIAGLVLGLWAWKRPRVEAVMSAIYDIMQTLPVFSYLVPIILFFGFGPVAALIATVIYAMPPMARNTTLALRQLAPSVHDLACMAGCTPRQGRWMVLLPSAREGLLSGLNQVIMLSLSAAIIASVIGAGGLGNDVLQGLKSMQLGRALEAGLAITLIAIVLDRLSRAYAQKRPAAAGGRLWVKVLAFVLAAQILAQAVPFVRLFPEALTLTTGRTLDGAIAWANAVLHAPISAVSESTVRHVLRPVKEALLWLPWLTVAAAFVVAAVLVSGPRLASATALMLGFIAATGYWEPAMVSLYLVVVAAAVAMVLGLPIGVLAALRPGLRQPVTLAIDTLQTLPTFVYLIPVVMLLGLGDFPALIAIVAYALPVTVRYAMLGILAVPSSQIEAADMSGCSPWQRLVLVQLPHALPMILLGLSQTVLMAFGMLVITALVGTRGLEQETLLAVSKAKVGEGLIAGLGISFLSILVERLMTGASARLRRRLGQA